jgi:hypothetical protein
MGVTTAFLNGKLSETIYMFQPPGYEVKGKENLVCKLNRSIYGLKQSPRTWYHEIDLYLRNSGWQRSTADSNLYYTWRRSTIIIMVIYIDDLLITSSDTALIKSVQKELQSKYRMKDLGTVKRYLGVEFAFSKKGIMIHQNSYAHQILQDAGMGNCKISIIPLPTGTSLSDQTETADFDQFTYCHTVGKLLYLTNTRPDLSYSVNYISRFMAKPQVAHWQAVLQILRYFKYTKDFGIVYKRHSKLKLEGAVHTSPAIKFTAYTDADWAACKSSRRSTGGYVF